MKAKKYRRIIAIILLAAMLCAIAVNTIGCSDNVTPNNSIEYTEDFRVSGR